MTRHLRAAAVAACLLATVTACRASAEPSGETPLPSIAAAASDESASPHETSTASAPPPTMESPAPVALQLSECEHTTGAYRAAVPEGWWVNPEFDDAELGNVSACRFFGPDDFEIMTADRYTPFPEGTAIWIEFLDEGCVGYINPILESRSTTVDGYPARISRLAEGKFETNPEHSYEYVVTVTADAQCGGDGEYILAFTRRDFAGDYEENKAVLDRMMESLQIGEP